MLPSQFSTNIGDFSSKADLRQVPEAIRLAMRQRALDETYYLAYNIMGFDKLTVRTHGPLCTFIDTCPIKRRLIQHPRSTFKSTIVTVTKRTQDALRDPTVRILIVGDTDTNAAKHLRKIRIQLERNRLLRWLFPDRVWEDTKDAMAWSEKQLYLPSNALHGEPTFDIVGAGGGVVSRHFDIINADDIIGEKDAYSPVDMDRKIEWFTGLESLFVPPLDERQMDIPSTYWRRDDVYSFAETFYGMGADPIPTGPYSYVRGKIAVFRRGAIENGESIFPEGLSEDFLSRLQEENPERYAAQYANNPTSSKLTFFHPEYRKYWKPLNEEGTLLRIEHDRGNGLIEYETIDTRKLQKISFCDPHAGGSQARRFKSARGAVLTTGCDSKGRIFILDAWIRMAKTNEIVDEVIRQNEKWEPEVFSIESNGFQRMLHFWLEERVERDFLKPIPYHLYQPKGDKDGDQRIRGLQPLYRAGHIYHGPGMFELEEEYLAWPRGRKDGLDALAQGLELWDTGWDLVSSEVVDEYTRAMSEMRSLVTGY